MNYPIAADCLLLDLENGSFAPDTFIVNVALKHLGAFKELCAPGVVFLSFGLKRR
jgi:hypothetical protein